MRVIPPGEFLMGSSEEELAKLLEEAKEQQRNDRYTELIPGEGPQHQVTLTKPYDLAAHEVTRGQFRQFVDATAYETDAEKDGKGGFGRKDGVNVQAIEFLWNTNLGFGVEQTDDHPVVNVSWNDAVAFCEWLSKKEGVTYRLPTEAEWEFACRAGSLARFSCGNEESRLGEYAWYGSQGEGGRITMPVAGKAANALGLFDLHGNAFEWCSDWHGPYEAGPTVDPLGPKSGSFRSMRGGASEFPPATIRSAYREFNFPVFRTRYVGFRVIRTFEKNEPAPTAHNWSEDQPAPAIAPFTAEEAKQHQEAWAEHLGTEVETTNSIGMTMRVIPPGEFLMGSSEEELAKLLEEAKEQNPNDRYSNNILRERPQHRVTLTKPYRLAAREVTRGQFRQFVDATGYQTDAEKDGKGGIGWKDGGNLQAIEFLWNTNLGFGVEQTDDHPVVNVSWNDAVAFCEWLSQEEGVTYRLPTEAEWEFACRAGSLARFSCGNEESRLGEYAWYGSRGEGGRITMPVAGKAANALGLFDMHGNVWEWCGDRYGPYEAGPVVDPLGSDNESFRSMRGGTLSFPSEYVRSAYRESNTPHFRIYYVGFRAARTIPAPGSSDEIARPVGDAEAAEWVISTGGYLVVRLDNGKMVTVRGTEDLPSAPFAIVAVLRGRRGNELHGRRYAEPARARRAGIRTSEQVPESDRRGGCGLRGVPPSLDAVVDVRSGHRCSGKLSRPHRLSQKAQSGSHTGDRYRLEDHRRRITAT